MLLCALPLQALAQSRPLEIDIVGGNAAALPIAVVPFGGNAGDTDIDDIVRADLARSGQFVQTLTGRLMMYAIGREVEADDMPQVRQIVRDTAKDNYRFFDIVRAVTTSDAFRLQAPPHEKAPAAEKPRPTVAAAR